jgi:hypothetical protein
MARTIAKPNALLDLPLEMLTAVCVQLDLLDLVRVAATCKRFRCGDGWLETVETPTKSPVVTALLRHAFPNGVGTTKVRRISRRESWIAYLARCARQRRCREVLPIASSDRHVLLVDAMARPRVDGGREGVRVG